MASFVLVVNIEINCLVDASEALVQLEGLNGLLLYSVDKVSVEHDLKGCSCGVLQA